jgi:hypothetical protein
MRIPVIATFLLSSALGAQQPASPPTRLFATLAGRWSCAGGFPDGRKLAADLTFTEAQGRRLLHFTHTDRAPGSYWQDANWLFDAKAARILSLATSGSSTNQNASAALFIAKEWTDASVVLEADTLKSPPWTQNRFSYTLRDTATMLMRWELGRNGGWQLGDSLVCRRSK